MATGIEKTKNAQQVRSILQNFGFTPLCKVVNSEHWVRDGRRVVLGYEGEFPDRVEATSLQFAYLVGELGDLQLSLA